MASAHSNFAFEPSFIPQLKSHAFEVAELRSEWVRVTALLAVFGGLLGLVLIRGTVSLAAGHIGEAWPFALLLGAVAAYEMVWMRFVKKTLHAGRAISYPGWTANLFVETLLPTIAIFLQVHTSYVGPERALNSPVILVYFLFMLLSTLHLDPALSRLSGVFSAIGYTAVSVYVFVRYAELLAGRDLLVYGTSLSCSALLLVGGYAAATVARQIQGYVVAALRDAEHKAKIAQFERDLGMARSIQQGLLPTAPPYIAGFEVAGWNQPADETGGDYFDWQQLSNGQVAITIADVTGHGIGPALVMSACRAYARAGYALEGDLQTLVSRLNRLLHHDLPEDQFVTLAAGLLDPQHHTLKLISAGHGPLIFYSAAQGAFYSMEAQGPPLGLLPNIGYAEPYTIRFGPGDILILVTDGFVEWANAADEEFGLERLQDVIRANRDKPPPAIISEIYSSIVKFVGSAPQTDDLTAVLVKGT